MTITITDPATDTALLSITELRAAAGVADNSRDVELTALGASASSMISRVCNIAVASMGASPPTLRQEGITETFRLSHSRHGLALARRPVVEIESVTVDDVVLDDGEYEVANGLLYRLTRPKRTCWTGVVVVQYTAGWDDVPDDLRYAATRLVRAEIAAADRDPLLKRKVTEGVSEFEWWVNPPGDSVVPPDVLTILAPYIRRWGWMS